MSDSAAHTAWAYMLLGFAKLTCSSPEPVVRESRTEHPGFCHGTTSGAGTAAPEGESMRTERPWSGSLETTGPWYTAGALILLPTSADSRSAGTAARRRLS